MTIGDDFPGVLRRAQAGEDGAIEVLYRDLVPVVTGYARAQGAREPDDVASEVFVAMVRQLDSFEGDEPGFRSWLLTIAHRRVVDDLRRRGRRPEDLVPVNELGRTVIDLTDGESEAMARLRAHGILDAIEDLTEDQRSVLLLRVLADLPVRDVADIVGKPESAVKALQRRALQALQKALKGEEELPD